MTQVNDLPKDLRDAIGRQDLIVFDGVCVLCCGFFRFMARHDSAQRFRFATAQSDLGQALYRALGLPTEAFETNLVLVNGHIHERLDAFAAAMGAIGWPWRGLAVLRVLPRILKDPAYHLIARNRFRLFGRRDQCLLPDAQMRARFVDL